MISIKRRGRRKAQPRGRKLPPKTGPRQTSRPLKVHQIDARLFALEQDFKGLERLVLDIGEAATEILKDGETTDPEVR